MYSSQALALTLTHMYEQTKIKEREWGQSLGRYIIVMTVSGLLTLTLTRTVTATLPPTLTVTLNTHRAGLCCGRDLSPLKEPGYLVLIKSGRTEQLNRKMNRESREQKLTLWMFEKVWIPYIERVRERIDPSYKAGDDTPSWLTVVWWFDGAILPLKSVTSHTLIEKLIGLAFILNKGNPGRTGVEQLLDVFDGFKRSKHWIARGTFPGATSGMLGASIKEMFTRYHKEHGLQIPAKKRHLIIDFASQYPDVVRKSFTSEGLIKAATRVGKYSPSTQQPDLIKIFRTIPADLTDIEECALLESVKNLMKSTVPRLDICEEDLEREREKGYHLTRTWSERLFRGTSHLRRSGDNGLSVVPRICKEMDVVPTIVSRPSL